VRNRNAKGQALAEGAAGLIWSTLVIILAIGLILVAAQAALIRMRVEYAAYTGAQAAIDHVTWSQTYNPSYTERAKTKILAAVDAELARLGLSRLGDARFLDIANPTASGVPGRYVFTVKIKYPFVPMLSDWFSAEQYTLSSTASLVNLNIPHGIALIYADNCDGTITAGALQKGGVVVPTYGGGVTPANGYQKGKFTQHRIVSKGSYVLPLEGAVYP